MRRALILAALLAAPTLAHAQAASTEERLRDALRKTTVDLRAAQDSEAALQAQLDQASRQRDLLQTQLGDLTAKLAAQPAPDARPAPRPAEAPDRSEAQVRALQGQVQSLQAALAKYQASYSEAAGVARAKDAESKQAEQAAKSGQTAIKACTDENAKLLGVADEVLHLYTTAGFKATVLGSYEPLLGLKKVELQNIVQDYEDKIRDHAYAPPAAQPAR